jgi:hypothetical protein
MPGDAMRERGGVALRSTFAQRVLLAVAAAVLISVISLAAEIGIFGDQVQEAVRGVWHPLWAIYHRHKGAFDAAALVIGTSVPALAGGLAILRKFYYAEIMLPKRLQELAEGNRLAHFTKRSDLLAYVHAPFDRRGFLEPLIFANPFAKIGSVFGYVSAHNQARRFASSVDVFEDEISALKSRVANAEDQKVTGHLLRGSYFEAEARDFEERSKDWRSAIEAARSEYSAALVLRPADIDALEGAARQCRALEDELSELDLLGTIVAVTDSKRNPLQHARALRQIAEIQDRKGTTAGWGDARARLVTASKVLEPRIAFGTPEVVEMAAILTLLGEVQTKREKFSAARTALDRAESLFATIKGRAGTSGGSRVEQALNALDEASRDDGAPDDD